MPESEYARAKRLVRDREYHARKRAAMTPEERAEARRAADKRYRETHRRSQSASSPEAGE